MFYADLFGLPRLYVTRVSCIGNFSTARRHWVYEHIIGGQSVVTPSWPFRCVPVYILSGLIFSGRP